MRLLLFATILLAPAPALAAPCTAQALAGTWRLVSIRSGDPGIESFYASAPHEVWRFGRDGSFIYVASNQPFTAARARQSLDQADARDGTSYGSRIEGDRLMLLRDGLPWEGFVCRIADRPEGEVRAGDMILANLPGRTSVQRVQRRLR